MNEGSKLRLLVWRAGGVRCGAPIAQLREILPSTDLAALPGAPAVVRGLANVRGKLLTVVDGRMVLGQDGATAPAVTILVQVGGRTVGLAVDEVEDLVTVQEAALTRPGGSGDSPGWVVRVDGGEPVRLLDLDKLLAPLFPE
ncbi:MAG: chemotaxis protein CheW [Gemmatimonadota bacterium]|jgi:purine-binding chemotaxis protein CheW|nr:chemotaxis protein CheW [Gemmatimonadota bacterium]